MYSTLKLIAALALVGGSDAFLRVGAPRRSAVRVMMSDNSEDLGFTPWKPKENQGFSSTDTPDFFEEDTVVGGKGAGDIDGTKQGGGTALSELMQTDSWTIGGREAMADRPDWFTATPMSVPDGTLNYAKSGQTLEVTVENGAMGYEDFYADFSDDTQGSWEVEPVTGKFPCWQRKKSYTIALRLVQRMGIIVFIIHFLFFDAF